MMKKLNLHKPGENYTAEGYPQSEIALELLKKHVEETKGQVRTRFPPEPNGILHIGHAKAININFGFAKENGGICFLRYDDTNPEKEEERFFQSILKMVKWLGYEPYAVTHSSDYFHELYNWAVVLIKKGQAYVCHQSVDDLRGFNPPASPWRDRPIEENLILFEDMKIGKFDEGEATLRMKITLEEGKQDPVAYRIKYCHHARTENEWCIYPTYDFTHCLCDSIENITHSLCTKEFQNRRSSYYWLCESVETYIPVQWEYGRLNINYTVLSKRKIAKLIEEKIIDDWDDPRLFTLPALQRRGIPSKAVNEFVHRMGITGAQASAEPAMLEACAREVLNLEAPRTMVVIDPLKITIEGLDPEKFRTLTVPNFPVDPNSTTHDITFSNVIYIERDDFRKIADKGYKRLSFEQPVGLRHAGVVIRCTEVICNKIGELMELKATAQEIVKENKPKGFIHWVSDPLKLKVNFYERLFKHKNPEDKAEVPMGYLSDVVKDSHKVKTSFGDRHLLGHRSYTCFQFERNGYFTIDPSSDENEIVFNQTVSLKEDSGKN